MRFGVGNVLQDCYEDIKKQWWGTEASLHVDCWAELHYADGFDIELKEYPYEGAEKLYFINLGGCDPAQFTELHENVFVVAEDESKAKIKALKMISGWESPHKDNQLEVETAICLNDMAREKKFYIHLSKTNVAKPFTFTCEYLPIGRDAYSNSQ